MWRSVLVLLGACRIGFDAVPSNGDGSLSDTAMPDAPAGLQFTYVKPSNTGFFDRFGWAVALSVDGNTLAVGAPIEDGPQGFPSSGSVYVFARTGGVWSEQFYLRSPTPESGDVFGASIALSADGNTLAVGVPQDDSGTRIDSADNSAMDAGGVFTFTRTGTNWALESYLKPFNIDAGDLFGFSVALSGDGSILVVGAPNEDSPETGTTGLGTLNTAAEAGAAYVFGRVGSTWAQDAYLKASNTEAGDEYGFAVAISAAGDRIVVGAPGEDSAAVIVDGNQGDNSATSAGAAYAYGFTSSWSQQNYLKPDAIDFGDSFGRVLAMSRDGAILMVAAPGEDQFQLNSGAVTTFAGGGPWTRTEKLKAFTVDDGDQFGVSLAATTTGADLYIGASLEDSSAVKLGGNQADNSVMDSGAAYAYSRHVSGTGWMVGFYGKATVPGIGDAFGHSIAVNGDGRVVAVGAPYDDSSATGINGDATNDDRMDSGSVLLITY